MDKTVRFQLKMLGFSRYLAVFRRDTWTPSGNDCATDYGIEFLGASLWVHLPERLFKPKPLKP